MTTPENQNSNQLDAWAGAIRSGSRRDLARAITLIESTRMSDVEDAQLLLERLLPATGKALRIGISGVPGAGKSTFIEALGQELIRDKYKVAVLAIDPSSPKSGGSILGDKTRMSEFARSENAFVRPSPAGQTTGGVTRITRESILLCEAAGFDVVLVETVGVGQGEWQVAEMVDLFTVLILPNAGDSLQGMKRGILELADVILVNKSDSGQEEAARRAIQEYKNAFAWTGREEDEILVRECSALNREVVRDCWRQIAETIEIRKKSGRFTRKREDQLRSWVRSLAIDSLIHAVRETQDLNDDFENLISDIRESKMTPLRAGRTLRELVLNRLSGESGKANSKEK